MSKLAGLAFASRRNTFTQDLDAELSEPCKAIASDPYDSKCSSRCQVYRYSESIGYHYRQNVLVGLFSEKPINFKYSRSNSTTYRIPEQQIVRDLF